MILNLILHIHRSPLTNPVRRMLSPTNFSFFFFFFFLFVTKISLLLLFLNNKWPYCPKERGITSSYGSGFHFCSFAQNIIGLFFFFGEPRPKREAQKYITTKRERLTIVTGPGLQEAPFELGRVNKISSSIAYIYLKPTWFATVLYSCNSTISPSPLFNQLYE